VVVLRSDHVGDLIAVSVLAKHHSALSQHFKLDCVEGGLQEMDGAVVGVDDEFAILPVGIFVSADQEFQI
jgi:hypothetical protein